MTVPIGDLMTEIRESVAAAKQGRTDEPRPRKTPATPADSDPWGADPRPQPARPTGTIRYVNGRAECSLHGRQEDDWFRLEAQRQSPEMWARLHAFIDGCTDLIRGAA